MSRDGNELTLAVIPARGGSKGITWKNLREIGFKPLIVHTIEAALKSESIDKVYVSTDSQRIADVAEAAGAEVPFLRPDELADDRTPLAAVMKHFLDWANSEGMEVGTLVILEPTSPLRTSTHIDEAISIFRKKKVDTVVSVERNMKLGWRIDSDNQVLPLEEERLNRQFLDPKFVENGAIFVTRPAVVTTETTIGKDVALYEMTPKDSIDINEYWEMAIANLILRSVKIVLHFKATSELGFGHFYRVLALANRLYSNEIVFVCSEYDEGLEKRISTIGWKYYLTDDPISVIKSESPTIVINDILDTDKDLMKQLRNIASVIVNFEDLGEGSLEADLVFNALYEDFAEVPARFGGGKYAIMRSEFLFLPKHEIRQKVESVTATFGGSDPNNIAYHTMNTLPRRFPDISYRIIVGPGYQHDKKVIRALADSLPHVELIDSPTDMAKNLLESDIAITSGGRTVFETAACGTPCIVICQNERELRHRHISEKDGVISLGLFDEKKSMTELVNVVDRLTKNRKIRVQMSERSSQMVDGLGIFRIIGLIEKTARMKGVIDTL